MPVRRRSSLPDYDESVWIAPGDPTLIPTIRAVWERSRRLCRPQFSPGVYKHATIEDANRMAQQWERQAIERARALARSG